MLQQGAGKDFGGFQSVCLGQTMFFSVERGKFIQILHTGHSHWVTIITDNTVDPVVCVYDSKFDVPSSHLSAQLACLLMTRAAAITVKFVDMKKQEGSYDCGIYAIAYATALAYGHDPAGHHYDQEKMRTHLRSCLLARKLTVFPHKAISPLGRFRSIEEVPVFCLCRMPEINGLPMIECSICKEWFHIDVCIKVPANALRKNIKWFCNHCVMN